jgi:hypothetical protein
MRGKNSVPTINSLPRPMLSLWARTRISLARSLLRSARSLALFIAPELAAETNEDATQ